MKAAQAIALFDGLDFVTPEQIQSWRHRNRPSPGDGTSSTVLWNHGA